MKKEFIDFLNSKETNPPLETTQSIYKSVTKDLQPIRPLNLMTKFLALNFSAGVLTLAICPQFGLGPLSSGPDVTHYFMKIGSWACALFCATFYFTIAQTLSLLILNNKENRWIAQKRFSVLPTLVISSFIALLMLGKLFGNENHVMPFETNFQVVWVLAGLIVSQVIFQIVSHKFKGLRVTRS